MTASSSDQLQPGAILAERYEIIRRLGAGGMGAVYLARHNLMDRLCALKVLPPGHHRDAEALERFTREARNASRIVHPNVCTVFDFGTTPEGVAYLAMEYLEGRTLGSILAEQPRLPLDRAVRLGREIAAGLDAAHELGIVHRDLKPDNVMVVQGRSGETVKLVDFGIAKALEAEPSKEMTAPGIVIGTPDYMSPEQFAGDPVDPRADVYALGVIFYRMVTGALPHTGETARATLTKRLTDAPTPIGDAAPDLVVPAGLQSMVNKVLARKPEDRYATAGAFAGAVVGLLTGPLEMGFAPTIRLDTATAPIARPKPSRGPWLVGAAGIGAVIVIAAVLWPRATEGGLGPSTPGALPPAVAADTGADTTVPFSRVDSAQGTVPAVQQPSSPTAGTDPGRTPVRTDPGPAPAPAPAPPPSAVESPVPTEADLLALPDPYDSAAARGASRARAEQIYHRQDADWMTRAAAAFFVATVHHAELRYADADRWAQNALEAVSHAPASSDRNLRARRYQDWRTMLPRTPS